MAKPKAAGKSPKMVELEPGTSNAWCACGHSANQPWCDGSHQVTNFTPNIFTVDKQQTAALCMCKQTKNPPYCDGTHMSIGE